MNRIRKKLGELEKNVVFDIPNYEETKITINNIAEQRLHEKAKMILKQHVNRIKKEIEYFEKDPAAHKDISERLKLSVDDQAIVDKSINLLSLRVFGLFDLVVGSRIHFNDLFLEWVFNLRFAWFINEISEWSFRIWLEDMIMSAPDFFSVSEKEQKRRLKPVLDNFRVPFSMESWDEYYDKHKPVLKRKKRIMR